MFVPVGAVACISRHTKTWKLQAPVTTRRWHEYSIALGPGVLHCADRYVKEALHVSYTAWVWVVSDEDRLTERIERCFATRQVRMAWVSVRVVSARQTRWTCVETEGRTTSTTAWSSGEHGLRRHSDVRLGPVGPALFRPALASCVAKFSQKLPLWKMSPSSSPIERSWCYQGLSSHRRHDCRQLTAHTVSRLSLLSTLSWRVFMVTTVSRDRKVWHLVHVCRCGSMLSLCAKPRSEQGRKTEQGCPGQKARLPGGLY